MVARTPPPTLPGLIAAGVLEPQLGALLWVLVDGGLPVVVVGEGPRGTRATFLAAVAQVRPERDVWPEDLDAAEQVRRYLLLARDGRTLGATVEAADLEGVFGRLERPDVGLRRDELGHLGIVVVLAPAMSASDHDVGIHDRDEAAPGRVVAVHWVRPVARDSHDHVQRLPPAVLGARDARDGGWEDFSWGVLPDLAARIGRRAGELEAERDARATFLADLAATATIEPTAVAAALERFGRGRQRRETAT